MPLFIARDAGKLPATDARVVRGVPTGGLMRLLERLRNRRSGDDRISLRKVRGALHRYEIRLNVPEIWENQLSEQELKAEYLRVLSAAAEKGLSSVVVPLLTGAPGFMVSDAMLQRAMETIREFLNRRLESGEEDMWVWLLLPEGMPVGADRGRLAAIQGGVAEPDDTLPQVNDETGTFDALGGDTAPMGPQDAGTTLNPHEEQRFWAQLHRRLQKRAEQPPAGLQSGGNRIMLEENALEKHTRLSEQHLNQLINERSRLEELLEDRQDILHELSEGGDSTRRILASFDEELEHRGQYLAELKRAAELLNDAGSADREQESNLWGDVPFWGDADFGDADGAMPFDFSADVSEEPEKADDSRTNAHLPKAQYAKRQEPDQARKVGGGPKESGQKNRHLSAGESVFGSTGGWDFPEFREEKKASSRYKLDVYTELDGLMNQLEESFYEMLFRLISEKHMDVTECYGRANLDRRAFSKIRNNKDCKPKKTTVAAFCIALKLDWNTACQLLAKAGYSMTKTNQFDVIIEYCIVRKHYDVDYVNGLLDAYEQPLLGSSFNESDKSA